MMEVCSACMWGFFGNPVKLAIVSVSVIISLISFILLFSKRISSKAKIPLIYIHIFTLIFPFVFYFFFKGCTAMFSACSTVDKFLPVVLFSFAFTFIAAIILTPLVYITTNRRHGTKIKETALNKFIEKESKKAGIKVPELFALNNPQPVAFTYHFLKSRIYISIGMMDILRKKEIEAVLLHEIYHISQRTSAKRFSSYLLRILSPLAWFFHYRIQMGSEEQEADRYACTIQHSSAHIVAAQQKVSEFYAQLR